MFNTNYRPWVPGSPEFEDHDGRNDKLPDKSEFMRDLQLHLNACKSTGLDGISEYSKSWLMSSEDIFQLFSSGLGNLERSHLTESWQIFPQFLKKGKKEDSGITGYSVSLQLPRKIMKIILRVTEKHLKGNAVIGHSQQVKILFNEINFIL